MTAADLVRRLQQRGARLFVQEGRLRINAPAGVVGEDDKAHLREHRDAIIALLGAADEPVASTLPRAARDGPLPCSPAQSRLWLAQQMAGSSGAYNLPAALRLSGRLDIPALEASLATIVARHEALRTCVVAIEGEPFLRVQPAASWALVIEPVDAEEVAERIQAHAGHAFDVAHGPLFDARLLRLSPEEHVLLLNMHHIVSDGWSMGVLTQELCELYAARLEGREAVLPTLPVQYVDYAAWQRQRQHDGELAAQAAFWKQRLSGAPALLPLPTDRVRPVMRSGQGATRALSLPVALVAKLTALAREERASLFMVLLAGFHVLLARLAGEEDVVVGTPVANRQRPELEPLIGFFVNTLALRGQVIGEVSFRQLLRTTREDTLAAFAHQDVPFEQVVETINPPRSASHSPVFQVMFALQNAPAGAMTLPGLRLATASSEGRHAKFDLTLSLEEADGAVAGVMEYSIDLFDPETVGGWCDQLLAILESAALAPDKAVAALGLQSGAGPDPRLAIDQGPFVPVEDQPLLPALLASYALERADATAVVFGERRVTFGELDAQADRLALALRRRGVGPEDRVGLCLPRSPELVVGAIAAWKVGAAYVPLDSTYPVERLRFICADAGVSQVVAVEATRDLCSQLGRDAQDTLYLEHLPAPSEPMRTPLHPAQAAYVIYTSGSTGKPKGVAIGHGALRNLLAWFMRHSRLTPQDRCSQIAQAGFDASVMEIWGCLAAGASLHIADAQTRREPQRLAQWLAQQRITYSFMPTPLAEEMLQAGIAWPESLRGLSTGGDQLRQRTPADTGFVFTNLYGPTEAAVVSLAGDVASQTDASIAIGRPIENTFAYILDPMLQPVAVGMPGELFLAGPSLARGYLGQARLTADRFLPDPFASHPGQRMYRTGDRVRWLTSGSMQFLGRVDRQVKLRGFRIELGEIEAALTRLEGVASGAVEMRHGPAGEAALVGYAVPKPDSELQEQDLRQQLQQVLPAYMVPTAWCVLPALPLGATGKVDRRALPEPQWQNDTQIVAPRDEVEQALAAMWSELLRVPVVGVHDDFFALGGHSLLATRLLARIQAQWRIELPLATVFESPTIASLAAAIRAMQGKCEALPVIERVRRDSPLPLSYAQQRLWFLTQLEPDSDAYHMPMVARLSGRLDSGALIAAFADTVGSHEVLRARIVEAGGEALQYFDHPLPSLPLIEIEAGELDARVEALSAQPFDLSRHAPLRAALFRLASDEHVLAMVVHHIVADGASFALFMRELAARYQARIEGVDLEWPTLPIQYGDYAHWQRHALGEAGMARQLDYWIGKLADVPGLLDLPTDRPRAPQMAQASDTTSLSLDSSLVGALRALSRQQGTTLFMTLLAAFKLLLSRLSGQNDVCIGTPISNRSRPELESVFGLFLGTLALRSQVVLQDTFVQLLQRVRETAVEGYAHQDVPFERIVDALKLERDLSRHPLFQVLFNMPGAVEDEALALPELTTQALAVPEQGAKFDLTLYAHERGEAIELQLHYNAQLFDRVRMDELLRQLRMLLQQVVEAPESCVGRYSLRTQESVPQLPDPTAPLDGQWRGSIPERFAQAAQAQPEHIALVDPRGQWTYRRLDAASNRVAQWLRAHAIGKDDIVALHATRRAELAVALLGVLKSGAAFMILDAAYPEGRLLDCLSAVTPAAWIAIGEVPAGSSALDAALAATRARLHLTDGADALDGWSDAPVSDPGLSADALSHIAFTSGSTGRPKAVAGRHGPFTHFLPWLCSRFELQPGCRYSVLSGLSHDPMQRDVLLPLMTGGTACFPDPEAIVPGQLAVWMREQSIQVANLTPAMVRVLTDTPPAADLPALRRAFVVGDVFNRADAHKLVQLAPSCEVVSFYGATETQWALGHQVVATASEAPEVVPLGHGFPDVQLVLRNSQGVPAGIGEVAEVCIRSPHIARGYLDSDPQEQARFQSSEPDPTDRLYCTGDLGRYAIDGSVRGLGRADRQVSIRGFRVELGEIESQLARMAGVSNAAVLHFPSDRLVAFVVTEDTADLAERVRATLRTRLPDYMLPGQVVALPRLPVTPNGKLDRAALRGMAPMEWPRATFVAPATATQQRVADIVGAVLGLAQVGASDDFFLIGGNSLSAVQVVSRLRAAFNIALPVRQLFQMPTVAGLADWLDAQPGASVASDGIVPLEGRCVAPLSFAQQRLWFLQRLDEDSSAYNMMLALRLRGTLDVHALRTALDALVARHAALRTVFHEVDGQAHQRVLPADHGLRMEILRCDSSEVDARLHRLAATPFDLTAAPPSAACLLQYGEHEYVLALALHHIITDGWSMGVLATELVELYTAHLDGRAARLPELHCQYLDYAAWQRARLQGEGLEQQRRFWRDHLQDQPPLLPLPTDRPRPARSSHRGAHVPLQLGADRVERLRVFCQAQQITPFMLLLGGYQLLLARYCGTDDVTVGFPIASRDRPELEPLLGLFANTLVLRTRPHAQLSVRDYLQQVRERTLEAYNHADMPFEAVVEMIQPQRSLAHSPVFQVMFNLQNMTVDSLQLPALEVEPLSPPEQGARFDLTLVLREGPQSLAGILEYATDLFDEATIQRMARDYVAVLDAMLAQPQGRIGLLPLTPSAPVAPSLVPSVPGCMISAFETQVRLDPSALAVVAEDESLSYVQLDARANALARRLNDMGVRPEDRIGVLLPRGSLAVAATLAVLKAGAAFVPLDPAAPGERLRHAVADAAMRCVLTTQALQDCLPGDAPTLCLDALPHLAENVATPLDPLRHPRQLAYAIYTSGTTGRPKAATLEDAGWAHLALAQGRAHGVGPGARVLQLVSSAFDVAVGDLALALANGATLVIAPDAARRDVAQLHALLQREAITHVQIPVALLAHLEPDGLPALQVVVAGGEEMPLQVRQRWGERVHLSNAYGPTETTVMATLGQQQGEGPIDIGQPLPGVRVHVLDACLQPVPRGAYGEIYVAGPGVGRGYLERAALTATHFLPEIGPAPEGARMYRTGDVGRWRNDGRLEIRGRRDHQVKLRGYRIELGEIEAVLREFPQISDAAVMLREDSPNVRQLVAYLVPEAGHAPDVGVVQSHARSRLMGYMVPSAWVVLEAMPLTVNGKLDRRALPAPLQSCVSQDTHPAADGAAAALAAVWARLLGRTSIGLQDNFFELGGDSILSIQAVALAAQAGWKITPKQVFECQTLQQLAAAAVPASSNAEQGVVTGEVPLAPIQRWFLETVEVQPTHWNQSVLLQPAEEVDVERVAQAVVRIQQHHDALRLRMTRQSDGWRQELAPADQVVALRQVVLELDSAADFSAAVSKQAAALQAGFDFDGSGLFAAVWFATADGRQRRLFLLAHHLLVDAVSWRILLEDLQALLTDPARVLPPKTSSIRVWAQRMEAHAHAEPTLAETTYWHGVAQATLGVPIDRHGRNTEACTDKIIVELTPEQTAALLRLAAAAGGINEILLTALVLAWRAWTGHQRLLVALEGHGRDTVFDDIDLSRTVGWFTLSHPLALVLPEDTGVDAALQAVRNQLAAVPRKGIGYGLLRGRDQGVPFESIPVSFNYLGQFDQVLQSEGALLPAAESTGSPRASAQVRPHEIDLVGAIAGGVLSLDVRYSRERLDRSSVEAFAGALIESLERLLETSAAQPNVLRADAQAASLSLIVLQAQGREAPLFCVHPAGGSVACYRPLALALGGDVPVYGLQAPALQGDAPGLPSFESMAAYYITAMRTRQPLGPYRLLGWSQGGVIALEVARQLRQAGESVTFLGLIDTAYAPEQLRPVMEDDEALNEQLRHSGFNWTGPEPGHASRSARLNWLIAQAQAQGVLSPGMDVAAVRRLLAMQREILHAATAYRSWEEGVDAVLFHATDAHLFGHLGERLGWGAEIARNWQHEYVPGDHFSCVQAPQATELAARVRSYLEVSSGPDTTSILAADVVQEPA